VPPKVFGCVCFVHDYNFFVENLTHELFVVPLLDNHHIKKGYICWCPSRLWFFVSMDVKFGEDEPFYGFDNDSSTIILSPNSSWIGREGSKTCAAEEESFLMNQTQVCTFSIVPTAPQVQDSTSG
jgi:hypothetical protein